MYIVQMVGNDSLPESPLYESSSNKGSDSLLFFAQGNLFRPQLLQATESNIFSKNVLSPTNESDSS